MAVGGAMGWVMLACEPEAPQVCATAGASCHELPKAGSQGGGVGLLRLQIWVEQFAVPPFQIEVCILVDASIDECAGCVWQAWVGQALTQQCRWVWASLPQLQGLSRGITSDWSILWLI